jgi:hypothetical protein
MSKQITAQRHVLQLHWHVRSPPLRQVLLAYRALISTPRPLGLDAAATSFSEERALRHVQALTAGGQGRLVGHPSIDVGIRYLAAAAQDIVSLASDRHDLHVEASCAMSVEPVLLYFGSRRCAADPCSRCAMMVRCPASANAIAWHCRQRCRR